MNSRLAVASCAAVAIVSLVGCSKTAPDASVRPGELPIGTASVTVNGHDVGTTDAVSCVREGALTTFTTGDHNAGTTTVIDNQNGVTTKSVSIRNLGGFTGSYWQGLDGNTDVHTAGATFEFEGEAAGFKADKPSERTTGSFVIKVAC